MPDALVIHMAVHYISLGYRVLPCVPGSKRPLLENGFHGATTSLERLRCWWRRWPNANLGLLPPAGVLVLDLDEAKTASTWERRYPELQAAPRTRTPRGGVHSYLRLPEGTPSLSARPLDDDHKIHLRGLGKAYLVTAPSRTSAGSYHWERPLVQPQRLPPASRELLARVLPKEQEHPSPRLSLPLICGDRERRYALGALASEHDLVAATPEGARNCRLNRAAYALGGYAAAGLLSRKEIEETLLAAAATCGLPPQEAQRTIRSGLEAGLQAPRQLPAHEHSKQARSARRNADRWHRT